MDDEEDSASSLSAANGYPSMELSQARRSQVSWPGTAYSLRLQPSAKTDILNDCGLSVDQIGRVNDWAGRPPAAARPIERGAGFQRERQEFSSEEQKLLRDWGSAAHEQGVLNNEIFEHLEAVRPSHSWQSWEGKWRRTFKNSHSVLQTDAAFPALDLAEKRDQQGSIVPGSVATSTEQPTSPITSRPTTPDCSFSPTDPSPVTFGHLRADTLKPLLEKLGLANKEELREFVSQAWIVDVFAEYSMATLEPRHITDLALLAEGKKLPSPVQGKAPHQYKITRALRALRTTNSVYTTLFVDKTAWIDDDHDVRFMVRIVMDGRAPGCAWSTFTQDSQLPQLCDKACSLMLWLRWVYKPSVAKSADMVRSNKRKAEWLDFLRGLRDQYRKDLPFSESTTPLPSHLAEPTTTELHPCPASRPVEHTSTDATFSSTQFLSRMDSLVESLRPYKHLNCATTSPCIAVQISPRTTSDDGRRDGSPEQTTSYTDGTSSAFSELDTQTLSNLDLLRASLAPEEQSLSSALFRPEDPLTSCSSQLSELNPTGAPSRQLNNSHQNTDLSANVLQAVKSSGVASAGLGAGHYQVSDGLVVRPPEPSCYDTQPAEGGAHQAEFQEGPSPTRPINNLRTYHGGQHLSHPLFVSSFTTQGLVGEEDRGRPIDRDPVIPTAQPGQQQNQGVHHSTDGQPQKFLIPQYDMSQSSKRRQQKGVEWMGEDALNVYENRRNARMASWGVGPTHRGTCILVPQAWAEVSPAELVDTFTPQDCPASEKEGRLTIQIGELKMLWTRASAWFETWPRRGVDFDGFTAGKDGPYCQMSGSHLCHHGFCINPAHFVYELMRINTFRNSCYHYARNLRLYGKSIPEHCKKHDPPCLLQHAALTTLEVLFIQLSVLRHVKGLPPVPEPPRPQGHPYLTFEYRLPLQMAASAVTVAAEDVLTPDAVVQELRTAGFSIRYKFCHTYRKVWNKVTAYWSHVKVEHNVLPQDQRLNEVKQSAQAYADWAHVNHVDLAQSNSSTWEKILQARADNFSWEVFQGWRLQQDRRYQEARGDEQQ